jgi:uncharacterized protein YlxW (UPF0749 family)
MNTQVANKTLGNITFNAAIGINEVVSVYVSKYENGLLAKKDDLSAQVREIKKNISDLDQEIIDSVDTSKFKSVDVSALDLSVEVEVTLHWSDSWKVKANSTLTSVKFVNKEINTTVKSLNEPIEQHFIKSHKDLTEQLQTLQAELLEVNNDLKTVSRKEREIRGRLAEIKMGEEGMADLVNNEQLLQLIQVK